MVRELTNEEFHSIWNQAKEELGTEVADDIFYNLIAYLYTDRIVLHDRKVIRVNSIGEIVDYIRSLKR